MEHRKFIDFVEDIGTDDPILTEAILESYSVCFLGESYKARNERYVNIIMEAISKNHPTALTEGILQSIRDGMGKSNVAKSLLLIVPAMFGAAMAGGGGGEDFDMDNELTKGIQEFSELNDIPTGVIDELKDGKSESGSVKKAIVDEIAKESADRLTKILKQNPDKAKLILGGMSDIEPDLYQIVFNHLTADWEPDKAEAFDRQIQGEEDKGPTPYSDAKNERINEEDLKNTKLGIDKLLDSGKDLDYVSKLANHLQNSDDPEKASKGNLIAKVLETMDTGDAGDVNSEKGETKLTQSHGSNKDLAEGGKMEMSEEQLKQLPTRTLDQLSKEIPLETSSNEEFAANKTEQSARSMGFDPSNIHTLQLDNGKWVGYIK